MVHYIENDYLRIGVKELGAEITSVISKKSGYEFLWQGNPDIWSGQSPILFPIIGRLLNDSYTLDGADYYLQKHGFARRMTWEFKSQTTDSISFCLSENEETLKSYPYSFDLIVTFTLDKNSLAVCHKVINKNRYDMYFSLGAHPAFNCEIGDALVFDDNENLDTIKIDLENSLRLSETYPLLKNERKITITNDIFNEDALIFKGVKSKHITLESKVSSRKIKFDIGAAPYLGIWAKPGAPYVCIEPWFGVNDSKEKKSDFSQKDDIQKLIPEGSFTFEWKAEFFE